MGCGRMNVEGAEILGVEMLKREQGSGGACL